MKWHVTLSAPSPGLRGLAPVSFRPLAVVCAGAACPEPQQQQAAGAIEGMPPLVRCVSLLDRRHILAQDASGHVQLWDIASGKVTQRFGQVCGDS